MANVERQIVVAVKEGERRRIGLDLKDMSLTGKDGIHFSLSAKRLILRW